MGYLLVQVELLWSCTARQDFNGLVSGPVLDHAVSIEESFALMLLVDVFRNCHHSFTSPKSNLKGAWHRSSRP